MEKLKISIIILLLAGFSYYTMNHCFVSAETIMKVMRKI